MKIKIEMTNEDGVVLAEGSAGNVDGAVRVFAKQVRKYQKSDLSTQFSHAGQQTLFQSVEAD